MLYRVFLFPILKCFPFSKRKKFSFPFLRYKNWRLVSFLLWHWNFSGVYLHSPGQVIKTIQHLYHAVSLLKIINWFHLIKYKTRWSQSVYPRLETYILQLVGKKKTLKSSFPQPVYTTNYRSHMLENLKYSVNGSYFIQGFHCILKASELGFAVPSLSFSVLSRDEAFSLGASPYLHRVMFPGMYLSWILVANT